nr:E4 protein [Lemur mastadenovirus]WGN96514.1 E4 protein [Lemur mastadenovirus]WGN96548.1 E4 protein [Lemur mastadenovirus]
MLFVYKLRLGEEMCTLFAPVTCLYDLIVKILQDWKSQESLSSHLEIFTASCARVWDGIIVTVALNCDAGVVDHLINDLQLYMYFVLGSTIYLHNKWVAVEACQLTFERCVVP